MKPLPSKGFRVFGVTDIFRHFWCFAPLLLLICTPDILSNISATNSERNKKNCYMLLHAATHCYMLLHKGEMTMTASKYPYSKICVFCQEVFLARKSTTLYCSHKCGARGYKENKRQEKLLQDKTLLKSQLTAPVVMLQAREVLSINEVSLLLGVSRWTVMRIYKTNKIRTFSIGTRRLILREELDKLLKNK
jgi:excisionase family DNA binding protein